ncbi:CarD family transcriptional regulator [Rhodoplanes serenus]|uniref:CarD family transcriptional regulator n=1 Tax=Rhodoplanes serenus TaxID=200615 RepID=A0A327K1C4_9BRAD|nr:CarD family transcriptional regulator [Rhodoplanes serenus]MBI5114038.1 CarD family transcriptional regulator [Rhodovulum sp.]MTW14659.1 CarD family transcriptional regulator [Rhodoplanes serenus]RAI32051.1 CarD family transcriptional regulator [Rhodoplanes serenus]
MAGKTRPKAKLKKSTAKNTVKTSSKASAKTTAAARRATSKTTRAHVRRGSAAAKQPAKTEKPPTRPAKPAVKAAAKASAKPAARPRVEDHGTPPEVEGAVQGMTNKKTTQRQGFKTNEFIVYPAHGVGQITAIEEQEVAGHKLELFVINFVKDKMTLRVPTAKIGAVGMRKLAEPPIVKRALETLKGRARVKRTMWSRRAQEYEAKINSGNIVAIAEVVRDLYRSESQPEQSYSERQLYEAALDRLAREISAVQRITDTEAVKEIEAALAKGPRRGGKAGEDDATEAEAA